MAVMTRDEILALDDIRWVTIDVPDNNGKQVNVKVMTGAERNAYEKSMVTFKGKDQAPDISNHYAKLAARCLCDDKGKRLFRDADIEALGNKSQLFLAAVAKAAAELNNLNQKDIEAVEKNSEGTAGPSS